MFAIFAERNNFKSAGPMFMDKPAIPAQVVEESWGCLMLANGDVVGKCGVLRV